MGENRNVKMPLLNWPPSALAALQYKGQKEAMTRLFDAYFRAAGTRDLTGTILHLDLPTGTRLGSAVPRHARVGLRSVRPKPGTPLIQPVGPRSKPGSPALQPDKSRHYFIARFVKPAGWVAQATLKPEFRVMT